MTVTSNFDQYYARQAKGEGLPVFSGGNVQRGHGIGSLLGNAVRIISPAIKSVGKNVLREGLAQGVNILGDVLGGRSLKQSTKRRLKEGGKNLLNRGATTLSKTAPMRGLFSSVGPRPTSARGRKRRKPSGTKVSRATKRGQSAKRRRVKRASDIFDLTD